MHDDTPLDLSNTDAIVDAIEVGFALIECDDDNATMLQRLDDYADQEHKQFMLWLFEIFLHEALTKNDTQH